MTPLELGILIHYRGSAADYRFGDFSAPAVRQTIDWFRGEAGLLEPTNRDEYPNATYRLTAKGEFLVDQLCAMPLPVSVWVMPNVLADRREPIGEASSPKGDGRAPG